MGIVLLSIDLVVTAILNEGFTTGGLATPNRTRSSIGIG